MQYNNIIFPFIVQNIMILPMRAESFVKGKGYDKGRERQAKKGKTRSSKMKTSVCEKENTWLLLYYLF